MPPVVFTIGYEKASQAEVLAALARAGVHTLIDVRDRPQSRRAGFSKRQLQAAIEESGRRYVHLKALGTPPEGREANRRVELKVTDASAPAAAPAADSGSAPPPSDGGSAPADSGSAPPPS